MSGALGPEGKVNLSKMTALQRAEILFLKEVKRRGGITLPDILAITEQVPEIDFGTATDGVDVTQKFIDLGFMRYDRTANKFVTVDLEVPHA